MDKNKYSSDMKKQIREICTELNDGKIAVVQATEKLLDLFSVSQQRELFDAILDFTEDLPMCSEDYNRDTLYKRYIAENCG